MPGSKGVIGWIEVIRVIVTAFIAASMSFVGKTFPIFTGAHYWLIFQIVGSFTAIQIMFTAHIGGFIAGVLLTKLIVAAEQNKRIKYLR